MEIRALFDWTKKYDDTWNWYDSETSGLPNFKHEMQTCAMFKGDKIASIKDSKKLTHFLQFFPHPDR
jgi:hypothetical protein